MALEYVVRGVLWCCEVQILAPTGPEHDAKTLVSMLAFDGRRRRLLGHHRDRRHLLFPPNLTASGRYCHDVNDRSGDLHHCGDDHFHDIVHRHDHDLYHYDGRYHGGDYRNDDTSRRIGVRHRDGDDHRLEDIFQRVDHHLVNGNRQVYDCRCRSHGKVGARDQGSNFDDSLLFERAEGFFGRSDDLDREKPRF